MYIRLKTGASTGTVSTFSQRLFTELRSRIVHNDVKSYEETRDESVQLCDEALSETIIFSCARITRPLAIFTHAYIHDNTKITYSSEEYIFKQSTGNTERRQSC